MHWLWAASLVGRQPSPERSVSLTHVDCRPRRRVGPKPVEPAQARPVGLALGGGVLAGAEAAGDVVLGGAGANEACCVLLIGIHVAMHDDAHS